MSTDHAPAQPEPMPDRQKIRMLVRHNKDLMRRIAELEAENSRLLTRNVELADQLAVDAIAALQEYHCQALTMIRNVAVAAHVEPGRVWQFRDDAIKHLKKLARRYLKAVSVSED